MLLAWRHRARTLYCRFIQRIFGRIYSGSLLRTAVFQLTIDRICLIFDSGSGVFVPLVEILFALAPAEKDEQRNQCAGTHQYLFR